MTKRISFWWLPIFGIIFFALLKQCEGEPKVITKTETKTIIKTDTVKVKEIVELQKPVYIERTKTIKGKDSIIYKYKPSETTITAQQFKTTLEANNANADLTITALGEVLDVSGTITYPEKETTVETIITRDASGFYIYANLPINNMVSPEVGVLMQIRNKMFISGGVQYNNLSQKMDFKIGLGIKL